MSNKLTRAEQVRDNKARKLVQSRRGQDLCAAAAKNLRKRMLGGGIVDSDVVDASYGVAEALVPLSSLGEGYEDQIRVGEETVYGLTQRRAFKVIARALDW